MAPDILARETPVNTKKIGTGVISMREGFVKQVLLTMIFQ